MRRDRIAVAGVDVMLEKPREAAIYRAGIEDDPDDAAERRRNIRLTTVLQVARILTERFEELCILRDISPNGAKAEIYRPVPIGDRVTIEFRTGHAVPGRVAWAHDPFVGVTFAGEVSVETVLSRPITDERIRAPRLSVDLPARLEIGDAEIDVRVVDISLAGAKVSAEIDVPPNTTCDLWLPAMHRKRAFVRWTNEGYAGLMFAGPIAFRDFAAWRQALAAEGQEDRLVSPDNAP